MIKSTPKNVFLIFMVMGLMAATRIHHFGDALHLPDASLAVFFMAGFFISSLSIFPVLLVEAGLIDYFAINVGGVSDWCFSPAYWFLIPTYGVLWLGGRWLRYYEQLSDHALLRFAFASVVSVSFAFFISNGSFYLFSGRFPEMSALQYVERVLQYYPAYTLNTLAYLGFVGLCYVGYKLMNRNASRVSYDGR